MIITGTAMWMFVDAVASSANLYCLFGGDTNVTYEARLREGINLGLVMRFFDWGTPKESHSEDYIMEHYFKPLCDKVQREKTSHIESYHKCADVVRSLLSQKAKETLDEEGDDTGT